MYRYIYTYVCVTNMYVCVTNIYVYKYIYINILVTSFYLHVQWTCTPTATQIIAAHPYSVLVREDVRLDGPVLRHVPQEVDGEALDPLVLPCGDGQLAVLPKKNTKPRGLDDWMLQKLAGVKQGDISCTCISIYIYF